MKNLSLISTLLLIVGLTSTLHADMKRYEVKSGIIEYEINGGGSIMGISTKTTGESKLLFKEYGNMERNDEKSSSTTMGRTENNQNTMVMRDGKFYMVNYEDKTIIEHTPEMLKQMGDKDMSKIGKDAMKKMGGTKVGTEKVLGYPCEIWEVMGTKTWLHKGVMLKTEANIMGMKHLQIAKSAKFNISISDKEFALPDFPKMTMQQMIQKEMQDHGASESNDNLPQNMPNQEQMQEMLKNLGGMFGGAK